MSTNERFAAAMNENFAAFCLTVVLFVVVVVVLRK
jgi:hypothetical protein